MKKILSLVVLVAALAMVSCAGNNNKKKCDKVCEPVTCEQCEKAAACDKCPEAAPACDKATCDKCPEATCEKKCDKAECNKCPAEAPAK